MFNLQKSFFSNGSVYYLDQLSGYVKGRVGWLKWTPDVNACQVNAETANLMQMEVREALKSKAGYGNLYITGDSSGPDFLYYETTEKRCDFATLAIPYDQDDMEEFQRVVNGLVDSWL